MNRVLVLCFLFASSVTGAVAGENEALALIAAYFGPSGTPARKNSWTGRRDEIPEILFVLSDVKINEAGKPELQKALWVYSMKDKTFLPYALTIDDFIARYKSTKFTPQHFVVSVRQKAALEFDFFWGLNMCNTSVGSVTAATATTPVFVSKTYFNCCF